jgi:outer membrane lipase/esterase
MKTHRIFPGLGLAIAAFLQPTVHAATYDDFYVLGDSLSDSGNYLPYLLSLDPTYPGQAIFTENSGSVWSVQLAEQLGLSAIASNLGGTNYAHGGARIDGEGYQFTQALSFTDQVDLLLTNNNGQLNSDALYSAWIGGNDVLWALEEGPSSTEIAVHLESMISNTLISLDKLTSAGARYIILPTVADISITPFGYSLAEAQQAQIASLVGNFNSQLMNSVDQSNIEIIPIPVNELFQQVLSNPARYGFTNYSESLCGSTDVFYCFEGKGVDVLGVTSHGIIHSIYFFDPNGHRLELTYRSGTQEQMQALKDVAPAMLEEWSQTKRAPQHAAWLHETEFSQ